MSDLDIRGLSADLGGRPVLCDIDLTADAGEFLGVLGPNGAGKSSLLRVICQLAAARSGEVIWAGRPCNQMSARERSTSFAYLPQGHVLHWPLSVRRVVELGRLPRLGPLSRIGADDVRAIDAAMALADVADLSERIVTTLSGGERARALLARAFAVEAPVLLADEPTTSLDPHHALQVMQALRRVAHEGRLVLAVTHDLALAARFCNRIVLLDGGRKVADGPPADVLIPDRLQTVYRMDPVLLGGWAPATAIGVNGRAHR